MTTSLFPIAAIPWDRLWPIALPALFGAVAIYFLLPRPGGAPIRRGTFFGLIALGLSSWLWLGETGLSPHTVLFYAFSAIAVIAGTLLITQSNPARAALSFALVVLSTTGLFLLLAAPFLMAATIIVYGGAIIVTFLFVLMLAQQEGLSSADVRSREPLLATITGFVLLGTLLYVLGESYGPEQAYREVPEELSRLQERTRLALKAENKKDLLEIVKPKNKSKPELIEAFKEFLEKPFPDLRKRIKEEVQDDLNFAWVFLQKDEISLETAREALGRLEAIGEQARWRYQRPGVLDPNPQSPLSDFSGPRPQSPDLRRDPATGMPQLPARNPTFLGKTLFTDYVLPVELGGTLLLVATVGAIAIASTRRLNTIQEQQDR